MKASIEKDQIETELEESGFEKRKIGLATLYLGDCLDILPTIERCDALITDPPYGIKLQTDYKKRGGEHLAERRIFEKVHGDDKPFDPSHLFDLAGDIVLWGGNYYSDKLVPNNKWLVWDKRVLDVVNERSDCELAWTNCISGLRIFRHMWNGFLRDSERGEGFHPTQKPVALFDWVLSQLIITPKTVLDPYMGSGPCGVSCVSKGIKYIGIEINKTYFDIACERIQDAQRQMNLFDYE